MVGNDGDIGLSPFTQDREYRTLMNSLQVSVSKHLLDSQFTIVWGNSYFYQMMGYEQEEYHRLFGLGCSQFLTRKSEDFQHILDTVNNAVARGERNYTCTARIQNKKGDMRWLKLVGTFTPEKINGYTVTYTVITDISDLMKAKREQSVTYNNIPGYVAKFRVLEDRLEFVEANEQYIENFGRNPVTSLSNMLGTDNHAILKEYLPALRRGEPVKFTIHAQNLKKQMVWLQLNVECVDWIDFNPIVLVVYIDITQQQEFERNTNRRLEELVYVDPITGGNNRTRFEMVAGDAYRAAPSATYLLVSLDIQKFKMINDMFGIEAGDKALQHVYRIFESHLAEGEYVARIAADTFNLLLFSAPQKEVEARLNQIITDVNAFNAARPQKYFLSVTAGIFLIDDISLSMTQIQDRANVARKYIKGNADAQLCSCRFYSDLDRLKLMREKEMENRMWDALQNGEFIVYVQPKQSLKERRIAGAEALVRWKDPQRGLIPPDEFIPYFERNRFIVNIDLYVFEQVCKLQRKWLDRGITPVPVSVNMSRVHLLYPHFFAAYEEIRERFRVPPNLLEIELTETLVFEHPQMLIQVINQIHEHGYRCSMDDFGRGYSSLNTLKDINVDTLKLDKAFFSREKADNQRERNIIQSVIELARKLNMTSIAEGVETQCQMDFLSSTACDMVQGYIFARPMPIDEFEKIAYGM